MQQPMGPPDPMGQHQVMLCPVRLVYETQILLQPGETIHPNQAMFMNAQNPPPWIQNRPQTPVIYMQQMPNSMMSMPQHMLTDQNQLYIPNYPYQSQMVQIDPMRQMPNVMTQNMMGLGTNVAQTMHNVGPGLQNVGQGMQNAGQGLQNVGPGLQNVGQGLQNVGPGLQNVGQVLQNVGQGLQNVGQGLQNVGPGLQNSGQGLQNAGPGSQNVGQSLQNVGQSIQNVGLNIGQNMPMGNVVQNVQKVVPNFTQNDRIVFNTVSNASNNTMVMANNHPAFNVNQAMPERPQMNQNLVNMQKVSELINEGLKQQNVKPPQVSVSPMPNANYGGDARSMTVTPRPQTNVPNMNLGTNNVQANAMAKNKVPLPHRASPGAMANQIRNHNQTYYRPIQPRPMSVMPLAQNQYQPMQSSSPAPRPYTQLNIDLNRKRKSESPDDTRKKYSITNNNFNYIHNHLIALHGPPNVQTFNINNTMNNVVQTEMGLNVSSLRRGIQSVKNVATTSIGTQASIVKDKPALESLKKALEMKAVPAIINDDLFISLQADNDKLLRNTVFTQARGLLRTEPTLQPDIISIKKIPTVAAETKNIFENVQNTINNTSNLDAFSIEVMQTVALEEAKNDPKKDFHVEIVIKRMNDVDDEPVTKDLPNRDPEEPTRKIGEVKAGIKKATETSNTKIKTRNLPNLDPIQPAIRVEEKAEYKVPIETLKLKIESTYLSNPDLVKPTISIEEKKTGNEMATETLKTRIKTRYLANLHPEEPTIKVEEEKAEIKRATEKPKTKIKTTDLPNQDTDEPTLRIDEEELEIKMASSTQKTKSKENKRVKKETKEAKDESRKVKVTSISDFKGNEIQIAEGSVQKKNTDSYILTHVLDGYVIQESNMAFPIRRPLKEKSLHQNSDKASDQKNEDSFKHRTEDGKVIQDNSRILAISDLTLSEDDEITEHKNSGETREVKSTDKSEENREENSEVNSEVKSEETSEENSEVKSEENSEDKSEETSEEKSKEASEETSEEISKEESEEICEDNPFTNLTPDVIKSWSAPQLTAHLSEYNWTETVTALTEHEIDGESLFLVSQPQLVQIGVSEAHADIICDFIK